MTTDNRYNQAAEAISTRLSRGLEITPDTLFFAESTYAMTPLDVKTALLNHDFEDRDILMELIFHPDRAARTALEPFFWEWMLKKEDTPVIAENIMIRVKNVTLFFVEPQTDFSIKAEDKWVTHYLNRLYMDRHNPDITRLLKKQLPSKTAAAAGVQLRCARGRLTGKSRQCLADFITAAKDRPETFETLFAFLLDLLRRHPLETRIDRYLQGHLQAFKKRLDQVRQFETKKDRFSMEYLMMQRYPVPCESEDHLLDQIRLMNTLMIDIFRMPPAGRHLIREQDLGSFNPASDLAALTRLLS